MFEERKLIFRSNSRKWSWRDSGKYRTGISGTFPGEDRNLRDISRWGQESPGTFPGEDRNLRDISRWGQESPGTFPGEDRNLRDISRWGQETHWHCQHLRKTKKFCHEGAGILIFFIRPNYNWFIRYIFRMKTWIFGIFPDIRNNSRLEKELWDNVFTRFAKKFPKYERKDRCKT